MLSFPTPSWMTVPNGALETMYYRGRAIIRLHLRPPPPAPRTMYYSVAEMWGLSVTIATDFSSSPN